MCKKCIQEGLVTNCSACIVKFKKMAKNISMTEESTVKVNTARTNTSRRSTAAHSNLHQ